MEKILEILKAHRGVYVSGEVLAETGGITRAAIWKQIEQLREIGYRIDSSPKKGYCLTGITTALHPLEIKDQLAAKVFGRIVNYQPEVDSTNRWARELAVQGAAEGTLVIAESQTKGRGRLGRSWVSAPGLGLWFSLILRPKVNLTALAGITLFTAVAMARTIKTVAGVQVQLKWPNDLVYQGRKLTGILAEMNGEPDLVNYLVVGVGVNVNQGIGDFPPELYEKAVSLQLIKGAEVSRKQLLQEFLAVYEDGYHRLNGMGLSEAVEYARQNTATLGKRVKISQGFGRELTGTALDLEADGSLRLREENGVIRTVNVGEIIEIIG